MSSRHEDGAAAAAAERVAAAGGRRRGDGGGAAAADEASRAASTAERRDRDGLYAALGLSLGATEQDIRAAYHAQSKIFHTDRQHGSEEGRAAATGRQQRLGRAYQVLSDPQLRAVYDALGERGVTRLEQARACGALVPHISTPGILELLELARHRDRLSRHARQLDSSGELGARADLSGPVTRAEHAVRSAALATLSRLAAAFSGKDGAADDDASSTTDESADAASSGESAGVGADGEPGGAAAPPAAAASEAPSGGEEAPDSGIAGGGPEGDGSSSNNGGAAESPAAEEGAAGAEPAAGGSRADAPAAAAAPGERAASEGAAGAQEGSPESPSRGLDGAEAADPDAAEGPASPASPQPAGSSAGDTAAGEPPEGPKGAPQEPPEQKSEAARTREPLETGENRAAEQGGKAGKADEGPDAGEGQAGGGSADRAAAEGSGGPEGGGRPAATAAEPGAGRQPHGEDGEGGNKKEEGAPARSETKEERRERRARERQAREARKEARRKEKEQAKEGAKEKPQYSMRHVTMDGKPAFILVPNADVQEKLQRIWEEEQRKKRERQEESEADAERHPPPSWRSVLAAAARRAAARVPLPVLSGMHARHAFQMPLGQLALLRLSAGTAHGLRRSNWVKTALSAPLGWLLMGRLRARWEGSGAALSAAVERTFGRWFAALRLGLVKGSARGAAAPVGWLQVQRSVREAKVIVKGRCSSNVSLNKVTLNLVAPPCKWLGGTRPQCMLGASPGSCSLTLFARQRADPEEDSSDDEDGALGSRSRNTSVSLAADVVERRSYLSWEATWAVAPQTRVGFGARTFLPHPGAAEDWARTELRLVCTRGAFHIRLPVVVSRRPELSRAAALVALPWLFFTTVRRLARPWLRRRRRRLDLQRRERHADALTRARQEAEALQRDVLLPVAQSAEAASGDGPAGLRVLQAEYGVLNPSVEDRPHELAELGLPSRVLDVTVPLNALRRGGRIMVPKEHSLRFLHGFYDVDPGGEDERELRVRYSYGGREHTALFGETTGVELPRPADIATGS
eukprot:TRINITY_DN16057_c0_g1_i2.p1 TRINITY_DN16057_c0_g1~~TRINITY_DN16057_c0_g1_i2.p1  ORF type:complete len:1034 (+),score=257.91 TRINITY_DN16057_c0_g1_i2:67-3168(+)